MSKPSKLDAALDECELHAAVLAEALADLGNQRPFQAATVKVMQSGTRQRLDQTAYRFIKLQDTLGERVLPGLLDLAEEPLSDSVTFQQKLRRLERLGAIPSADAWRLLREIRNQIAHEYPDAPAIQAAMLEALLNGAQSLIHIWDTARAFRKSL